MPDGPGYGDGFVDDRTCSSFPCLIFEDDFDFLNHRVWEHELTASGGGVSGSSNVNPFAFFFVFFLFFFLLLRLLFLLLSPSLLLLFSSKYAMQAGT